MGLLVCPHCGKAAMCGDVQVETQTEEYNSMIPKASQDASRPLHVSRSFGSNKRKGTGFKYLNADILSSAHQLAQIAGARVIDDAFRKGEQCVETKLKFKGEYILWTLRPGNPNLDVIADALGEDESAWAGHEVELFTETDDWNGKTMIRVEMVKAAAPPKKGR
jgi:hypothetical protein